MLKLLKRLSVVGVIICGAGCANRVAVVDTAADVVRLDRPARASVSVWRGGHWEHAGQMDLPAGWYAGPGPLADDK